MADVWYCVYHAVFRQAGADHEGLILVRKDAPNQGRGNLLHVTGDLGLGMEFEKRLNYNYAGSRTYKSSELIGYVKSSNVESLEAILKSITPPHDERVMFERRDVLEARDGKKLRDCQAWVQEAVRELQRQHILANTVS